MVRVGVIPKSDNNDRKHEKWTKKALDTVPQCSVLASAINALKDASPSDVPLITPMDPDESCLHSHHDKMFETFMLMCEIVSCDCCGLTQPCLVDPHFPSNSETQFAHENISLTMGTLHGNASS